MEESFVKSSPTEQEGRGQMSYKPFQLQPVSLPPTQLSVCLDSEAGRVLVVLSPVMLAEPSWALGT